jgi:hypothetical protein
VPIGSNIFSHVQFLKRSDEKIAASLVYLGFGSLKALCPEEF